jgi:hypothetical protein
VRGLCVCGVSEKRGCKYCVQNCLADLETWRAVRRWAKAGSGSVGDVERWAARKVRRLVWVWDTERARRDAMREV